MIEASRRLGVDSRDIEVAVDDVNSPVHDVDQKFGPGRHLERRWTNTRTNLEKGGTEDTRSADSQKPTALTLEENLLF